MLTLSVQKRDTKENPDSLRGKGIIPAVFYGPKEDATPISVDSRTFEKLWKEAGETTIVTLNGLGDDKDVLIHRVDEHPVTGVPQHIDFYAIDKTKLLHVKIPIEFIGEAPAEKAGHIVVKALHELPIKVSFSELPQHFEVDLSSLSEIGDHIPVSAITLPSSAELDGIDGEETVATVAEAKEEPIEEPTPAEGEAPAGGEAPAEGEAAAPEAKEDAS